MTYLEIQVALVVLGIGLAGICPLVVMQMKLLRRIESTPIGSGNFQVIRGQRIIDGNPYGESPPVTVLQPASDLWMRRIGTAAPFQDRVGSQPSTPLLTEATIDDGDATFAGTWSNQSADDAQGGAYHTLASGNPTSSATWTFATITPGRYRVMISWPTSASIPSDVTFTFPDASSNEVVVSSNQTIPIGNGPWRDLGNHHLGASLVLRVSGSITGQVVADAVRIGARNTVTISKLASADSPSSSEGVVRRAKVVPRP